MPTQARERLACGPLRNPARTSSLVTRVDRIRLGEVGSAMRTSSSHELDFTTPSSKVK
jgi:hypothetical protein